MRRADRAMKSGAQGTAARPSILLAPVCTQSAINCVPMLPADARLAQVGYPPPVTLSELFKAAKVLT